MTRTTTTAIDRRSVLRLLSLATLATTAVACSRETDRRSDRTTDGEQPPAPVGSDEVELVSADVTRSDGDPDAVAGVVAAMHATGGALYGSLVADAGGNLAISPYSVSAAMALTANGAQGETLDQLEIVFGGTGIDTVNGGLNALTTHLESLAGEVKKFEGTKTRLDLDAANALFGQRGFTWGEPFLETLAASYGAGMNVVDWAGDTEAARRAVNAWTAKQTRDKIEEILPKDAVTSDARLVLVNTLYLKAPWNRPFEPELTEDADFTLLDGSTVRAPQMRDSQPNSYGYAEGAGWRAARLDYAGGGVAMTVVLPDEGRFDEVEQQLVTTGAATFLADTRPEPTAVALPSWTFRFHGSLVDPIKALGVALPFEPAADFSGLTTDDALFIGAIEHEVFIAVDEQGTEAAAATAVVAIALSAGPMPQELVVDRPFLFVIHDVEHGTPLFVGRVLDPTAE